jgi:non-specific serine/threonine protein kinase/serine/threonine-protein kinase
MYELLTGTTPFDKQRLETAAFDETLRIIREEEPPRPSVRLSSANPFAASGANRGSDTIRLNRRVPAELDWIVMKALEKDRNRRYETASALASDVSRYLNDEPVSAGPASRLYRAGKLVRRNKWPVLAFAAVFFGLVAAVIGTAVALVSQSRQRQIAEQERAEAQLNLASALHSQRKFKEAEELYRRELQSPASDDPESRRRAARTLLRLGQVVAGTAETERVYHQAVDAHRAAFPPGDPSVAHALSTFAQYLRGQHRFQEAEPLFREAYEISRRAATVDHNAIGVSATYLGAVLISLGRFSEADTLLRKAIAQYQLDSPPDEWAAALARLELARNCVALRQFSEAEAQLQAAISEFGPSENFYSTIAMVALYTAWDRAEPGTGRDLEAQKWLLKFIEGYYPQVLPKKVTTPDNLE